MGGHDTRCGGSGGSGAYGGRRRQEAGPADARRANAVMPASDPAHPDAAGGAGDDSSRTRASPKRTVQPAGQSQTDRDNPAVQVIQPGFWRRTNRRRRQHQQSAKHSRIQSQESLRQVAVYLRSDHGSRRFDHHAGAARVAGAAAAAAEFHSNRAKSLLGVVEIPFGRTYRVRRPLQPTQQQQQ